MNEYTIAQSIYDTIFKNDNEATINFINEFENAIFDGDNATIELDNFIVKIERA